MYYFFAKFLPLFVMPLMVSLLLAAYAVWQMFKNKKSRSVAAGTVAILVLYLNAIPFTARILADFWEGPPVFPVFEQVSGQPANTAIVVLGGFTERLPGFPGRVFFGGGIDRLIAGIELWREKKAPFLVLSGGTYPGEIKAPEAFAMRDFAVNFARVPADSVLIDPKSANTEENARFTAALFDSLGLEKNIILVTSASHMPRAERLFRAQKFTLTAYKTDFTSNSVREQHFPYVLIPSADNLQYVSKIYREMIGYLWQTVSR